jgi:hypothetical protein
MPLGALEQLDFSGGIWRQDARDLVPANGAYDIVNFLTGEDDGILFRRGGSQRKSTPAISDAGGIVFIWDGRIAETSFTLLGTQSGIWKLDTDDTTPVDLSGAPNLDSPRRAVSIDGKLYLDGGWIFDPAGPTWTAFTSPASEIWSFAVNGERLLAGVVDKVYFSAWGDATNMPVDDYHQIPDGGLIIGVDVLRNVAMVFTTTGLWTITNMDFDELDDVGNVQHLVERADPSLILWRKEGIATWRDALIVPAMNGIWLTTADGGQERIDTSIAALYRSYLAAGYMAGNATVFRSHYFLPILNPSFNVVDLLVCRLDRPYRSRAGTAFPWFRFTGNLRAFALRSSSLPAWAGSTDGAQMLAGSGDGYVVRPRYFEPGVGVDDDAGTNFECDLITRDFATGEGGNENTVRWMEMRYQMLDTDDDDDPTITAKFSTNNPASETTLTGTADENTSRQAVKKWPVNEKARFIRFHFHLAQRAGQLIVRSVKFWARQSTRAD